MAEMMADLRGVHSLVSELDRCREMAENCFCQPMEGSIRHRRRHNMWDDRLRLMTRLRRVDRRIPGRVNVAAQNDDIDRLGGIRRVLHLKQKVQHNISLGTIYICTPRVIDVVTQVSYVSNK